MFFHHQWVRVPPLQAQFTPVIGRSIKDHTDRLAVVLGGDDAGLCRVGGCPLGEASEGETTVTFTYSAAIVVWVGAIPLGEGYRGAIVGDGDVAQVRILALTGPFEEVASGEGYAVLDELVVGSFALGF